METHSRRPSHGPSRPAPHHRPNVHSRHDSHSDADSAYAALVEPPNKFRKTQAHTDKSRGAGTISSAAHSIDLALHGPSSRQDDIPSLPYPIHQARIEPADPTPIRAPPRESLKNGLIRAGVPSPPVEAPRHPAGLNDYFPWERKHPEDVLTEPVTRTGYFEKAPSSSAELVSARPSIISCIKNKTACEALSSLLVASLQRRQQLCSVLAKNTFKPPPRVTLTDNKREAWLRDLADGAIPLRRLSRTIPHGIRGKSLLDHCLAKHVPTWRAIWLVKCVGSNEIRAFRRKGAGTQAFGGGGELKWLKDWTDGVLDFIDSLTKVADPKNTQGREHITYALSLISHVYHEQLLDQNLFNQCITARLRDVPATSGNAFCLWTSVAGQYLADLLKCSQRGCDLVKCLLAALESLGTTKLAKPQQTALSGKCRKLLTTVLSNCPSSFVLPESWSKWKPLVRGLIEDDNLQLLELYRDLERRNALLSSDAAHVQLPAPSEADDDTVLDQFDVNPDPDLFISTLQRLASDSSELVRIPIDWCTSCKRFGIASIYLVARVIRLISKKLAYSCQDDVSRLLASVNPKNQLQARRLHMLTAELVRSHHFSISKYLHFLLARGMSALTKTQLTILAFVPRQTLSTEVLNLATSMCSHLKCSLISNKDEVDFQVAAMQLAISRCRPTSGLTVKDHAHISGLDMGTRAAIALHLRKDIATKRAEQSYPSPDEHDSMDLDVDSLQSRLPATLATFELLQDFPTLADVLLLFIPNADVDSLLILASCVYCHHRNFQAMSALQRLFPYLLKRYAILHSDASRDRQLIKCLIDIARQLPSTKSTIAALESHLDASGTENMGVACSPLSDQMFDKGQSQNIQSLTDLESLLQSGNVTSEGLLGKMLVFLTGVLETSQQDPEQMVRTLKLLRRLAESDRANFSSYLARYLHSMLGSKDTERARQTLPWIVAGDLCPVDEMVAGCLRLASDPTKKHVASQVALNLLLSLATPATVDLCNCVRHYYAFSMIQNDLFENKQEKLVRLTELALGTTVATAGSGTAPISRLSPPQGLEPVIFDLLCSMPRKPDLQFEDSLIQLNTAGVPVEDMLCRMMKLYSETLEAKQKPFAPMTLLHKVSEAVTPEIAAPCRILAQIELNKLEKSGAPLETLRQAASSFVGEASVWRRLSCWGELTRNLSTTLTSTLHECSLNEILKSMRPLFVRGEVGEDVFHQFNKKCPYVRDMILVLEATQAKISPQCLSMCSDMLVKSLGALSTTLDMSEAELGPKVNRSDVVVDALDTTTCLLLHLSAIYTRPAHLSVHSQERLVNMSIVLSKIYIDLSDASQIADNTATILLDVLLHTTRSLPEDGRFKCLSQLQGICDSLPDALDTILGSSDKRDLANGFILESPDDFTDAETPTATPRPMASRAKVFNIDAWEMLQDTTPAAGPNDTCLNLSYFGARKAIL